MATKTELTKEEKIKKEFNRLKRIFKDLDQNKKQLVTPLLEKAAFMSVSIDELQEEINANGFTEEYQNGANQFGKKKSVAAEMYTSLTKNYTAIIKQLTDLVPAQQQKQVSKLAMLRQA